MVRVMDYISDILQLVVAYVEKKKRYRDRWNVRCTQADQFISLRPNQAGQHLKGAGMDVGQLAEDHDAGRQWGFACPVIMNAWTFPKETMDH